MSCLWKDISVNSVTFGNNIKIDHHLLDTYLVSSTLQCILHMPYFGLSLHTDDFKFCQLFICHAVKAMFHHGTHPFLILYCKIIYFSCMSYVVEIWVVHSPGWVCKGQKTLGVFLYHSLHYSSTQGLFLKQKLSILVRLAIPGIWVFLFPNARVIGMNRLA